jgi:hypothetical protein
VTLDVPITFYAASGICFSSMASQQQIPRAAKPNSRRQCCCRCGARDDSFKRDLAGQVIGILGFFEVPMPLIHVHRCQEFLCCSPATHLVDFV